MRAGNSLSAWTRLDSRSMRHRLDSRIDRTCLKIHPKDYLSDLNGIASVVVRGRVTRLTNTALQHAQSLLGES